MIEPVLKCQFTEIPNQKIILNLHSCFTTYLVTAVVRETLTQRNRSVFIRWGGGGGGQLKKYALKGEGGVTENITLFKASAAEQTFCPK